MAIAKFANWTWKSCKEKLTARRAAFIGERAFGRATLEEFLVASPEEDRILPIEKPAANVHRQTIRNSKIALENKFIKIVQSCIHLEMIYLFSLATGAPAMRLQPLSIAQISIGSGEPHEPLAKGTAALSYPESLVDIQTEWFSMVSKPADYVSRPNTTLSLKDRRLLVPNLILDF